MNNIDAQQMNDGRKQAQFEHMIEYFLRTWAPRDLRDRDRFSADLMSIIRQTYTDAQEPMHRHLNEIVRSLPVIPWPPAKAEGKSS